MRVEIRNLSDHLFAGLRHEEAVVALLDSVGAYDNNRDGLFRFDGRYLGVEATVLRELLHNGGSVESESGEVFAEVGEGPCVRVKLRSTDHPMGRGWAERAVVNRLLGSLTGVVLHDPDRIWIEAQVIVHPGAVLWGGVVLRGSCEIGAAEIGAGAVLSNTTVADGAVVKPYSVCSDATIGCGVNVGPMAHLRPGAILEREVKVGNFVEVKKSMLRAGCKVSHLTYIGDAEIGEGANIGAGTITANYDGYNKWRTTVGAGANIGSNTVLVAPVRIGERAIVGGGSTITVDVPDDALAVERAKVKVLANVATRIRKKNKAIKEKQRG